MLKTAEGALDEVQRLLRDIRGLAVHSANSAARTRMTAGIASIVRLAADRG